MALDVWIMDSGRAWPGSTDEMLFGFGGEHDTLLRSGYLERTTFPLLFRMEDYYNDTRYEGEDLPRLVLELNQAIPKFESKKAVLSSLHRFRDGCLQAVREGKSVLLLAD